MAAIPIFISTIEYWWKDLKQVRLLEFFLKIFLSESCVLGQVRVFKVHIQSKLL